MDDMSVLVAEPVDVVQRVPIIEPIREIQGIEWAYEERPYFSGWPTDLVEAYERYPGPYTGSNAEVILDEENVELYNGWLVLKKMTSPIERKFLSTAHTSIDIAARYLGFGQVLPDQLECQLHNKEIVKPDASLISWERVENRIGPVDGGKRDVLYGGPELVIEVRSPSNRRTQEKRKRTLYFASDVQTVWDVDEKNQCIYVYHVTAPDEPVKYEKDEEINCEPFLPGWRVKVADLFEPRASAETIVGEIGREWRKEARKEGFTEGKEEGFSEGEQAGIVTGIMQLLPLLVQVRFGLTELPDLNQPLANCSVSQLQVLQQAVTTADNFEAWFAMIDGTDA